MACALWVMHYGSMTFEVYDSEEDAAMSAVGIADAGTGSVVGVQFEDGRLIKRADWAAYEAAGDRAWAEFEEAEQERRKLPPVPTRQIVDPFYGKTIQAYSSAPAWLGALPDPTEKLYERP